MFWEHRNGEWGDHVTLQAAADWVLTQPKHFLFCRNFLCKMKESLGNEVRFSYLSTFFFAVIAVWCSDVCDNVIQGYMLH